MSTEEKQSIIELLNSLSKAIEYYGNNFNEEACSKLSATSKSLAQTLQHQPKSLQGDQTLINSLLEHVVNLTGISLTLISDALYMQGQNRDLWSRVHRIESEIEKLGGGGPSNPSDFT